MGGVERLNCSVFPLFLDVLKTHNPDSSLNVANAWQKHAYGWVACHGQGGQIQPERVIVRECEVYFATKEVL